MQKCFVSLKVLQLCGICFLHFICSVSLVGQMVKNLYAKQETWIQPLGWEDPLEEGMATHSSVPAWNTENSMDRGAWWATAHGVAKESAKTGQLTLSPSFSFHI